MRPAQPGLCVPGMGQALPHGGLGRGFVQEALWREVGGPHWALRVCCLRFPPRGAQPRVHDTCVLCFLGPTPAWPAASVRFPGATHVDQPDFSFVFGTWCGLKPVSF